MQCLIGMVFINLAHYYENWEETSPAVSMVNSRFHLCTSLVPRPMIVVFGLGTRLHVCMCTKLENGVLRNSQQPQSAVNGFCEFEAMKTLSSHRAPRCNKYEFRAKMTVSTQIIFEISLLNIVVSTRRIRKMAL